MVIDPNNVQNIIHREVFSDPSPGYFEDRIVRQFSAMLGLSDLADKDRDSLFELLIVMALKFAAIWTHDDRYAELEKRLIAKAGDNPIDRRQIDVPIKITTAQGLYIEFDGFLVQVKSVLDHMINILHYTLGLKFSGLSTFGGNGDTIIRQLKNNVCAEPPIKRQVAQILVNHITINQGWLKGTIDTRDRMNHFMDGKLSPKSFAVALITDADGNQRLHRPQISNAQTVKDLMHIILHSTLDFVEHFMGHAMSVRMPTVRIEYMEYDDLTKPRWFILPAEPF